MFEVVDKLDCFELTWTRNIVADLLLIVLRLPLVKFIDICQC